MRAYRRMRIPTGMLVAIGAITIGCSEPSASPSHDYELTMFSDSAQDIVYSGGRGCNGYCEQPVRADSTRAILRLHVGPLDSALAAWDSFPNSLYRGTATIASDGSLTADVIIDHTCDQIHLVGTDVNGSISGTWSQILAYCHTGVRWGHFTGHR
jgi:hypothetical protein